MSAPRNPNREKGGFVSWGDSMGEMVALTGPQMTAFVALLHDAPKTTTGKARTGKATYICDHEVVINATVAGALKREGLVEVIYVGSPGSKNTWCRFHVRPTDRGVVAWWRLKAKWKDGGQ